MGAMVVSMFLMSLSGAAMATGYEKHGIAVGAIGYILSIFSPIIMYVFVANMIIWAVSFGIGKMFSNTTPTKSVGVYMPGAKYPLGGFKKPTIKNMLG